MKNVNKKNKEIVQETILCENKDMKCLQYKDANLKDTNNKRED